MRRFAKTRWWALALTLGLLIAGSATFSSPTYGDGKEPICIGDEPGLGGGGSPPMGDPDGPAGPNKYSPGVGRLSTGRNGSGVTAAGDGGTARRVGIWHLQVVLRSLMSRWVRF